MTIDDLSQMATLLLAISLASERVVTMAKTVAPVWLADEKKTDAQETDLVADKGRRVLVLLIAFVTSWITASFLADNPGAETLGFKVFYKGVIHFGSAGKGVALPVLLVGLLASGGSSLWNNVLGYTKAVKDIRSQQKATESLNYQQNAKKLGLTTYDTGNAVRQKVDDSVIDKLSLLTDPSFKFGQGFTDKTSLISRI